jgi:hypothetical protein
MTYPTFTNGTVLPASDLNAIGLWLVKTQTVGTGVSSVTVTGAFSADYENYKIIYNGGVGSLVHNMKIQLGSATTSYYGFGTYGVYSGATVFGVNDNNAATFRYVGGGDSSGTSLSAELRSPYLSAATYISADLNTGTSFGYYAGRYFPTTSFTAFTMSPDSGTLTGGTISVYGYRKA